MIINCIVCDLIVEFSDDYNIQKQAVCEKCYKEKKTEVN